MENVVIVGAAGVGRRCIDIVKDINAVSPERQINILGVVDDAPSEQNLDRLQAIEIEYLGTVENYLTSASKNLFVLAIGNPAIRTDLANRFLSYGHLPLTIIHPSAYIGSNCEVGDGSVICGGVQISTNTTIGKFVHINPSVTIGHDVVISDYVSINPSATISGDVFISKSVLIGASATVLQQITIGEESTVGACACVTKSIPPRVTVIGVPAKIS